MIYEILTGEVLFHAPDEIALVTAHISHDGWLEPLQQMSKIPKLDRLANLIGSCLRHDARNRPTVTQVRNALTAALLPLTDQQWPLEVHGSARSAAPA
jgi:serine/threonine protein kinase